MKKNKKKSGPNPGDGGQDLLTFNLKYGLCQRQKVAGSTSPSLLVEVSLGKTGFLL